MTDARELVGNALKTITPNVKMSKPDGKVKLPLICYAETSNTVVNIAYDRVKYRVAVYASTFEQLVDLIDQVDAQMHDTLGFTRTAKTSDGDARAGTDLYLCRMDYSAMINKIYNYIVRNST